MKNITPIIVLLLFSISFNAFGQGKYGGGDGSGYHSLQINNISLPVELLYFEVFQINDRNLVQVQWQATSEINFDNYIIERSENAMEWEPLGSVYSNNTFEYTFMDESPFNGLSYYRLRQVDLDGTYSFSQIRAVNISIDLSIINIYPNPSSRHINIKIDMPDKNKLIIRISDLSGKVIWKHQTTEEVISWFRKIELKYNGVYFINIQNDSNSFIKKFIIVNES